MTQVLNISETGRRAFFAGLKTKDCPFAIRSDARSWWMKGYREAKAELESDDGDAIGAMMGENR